MRKLKITFENCYGIAKLNTELDFSSSNAKIIYAPNGCMKTSFAKTMTEISKGGKPKDEIFIDRISVYEILDGTTELTPNKIQVVEPYSESYSSKDRMSTLLVNMALKDRYAEILNTIETKKAEVLKSIKLISGSSNAELEINSIFNKKIFFESLDLIASDVANNEFWEPNFKYGEIINTKVQDFLKDNSGLISDYLNKYTELTSSSDFFKKGIFGTDNASGVKKSLTDNRFFDAKHKVILKDKTIVESGDSLGLIIKKEKERILTNEDLVKKFEKIDTAITKNAELKSLKKILEADPTLLAKLSNYDSFKKSLWINYFSSIKENFKLLLEKYHQSQKEINEIIQKANSEKTEWEVVVSVFNSRFDVPFKLKVANQDDVILKDKTLPNIVFTYQDSRGILDIEESSIKKVLSTGERRALYLLNVIFEIEARKKEGVECLLIMDDIADSFDYKNKYAIIEYLKDISETGLFKMLILTHNFDFYRTVASRLPIDRADCYMTIKNDNEVKIVAGNYLRNVFDIWVKEMDKRPSIFLASIPFARNIIEYIKGEKDSNYLQLTNLLHVKSDTKTTNSNDLASIYNTIWTDKTFNWPLKSVYDMILEETNRIIADSSESVQLENKIILSMIIRLVAEDYMIKKISRKEDIGKIKKNQTTELLKLFKTEYPNNSAEIKLMEQVNLMTAENIHINAFMYEPILDLSDKYLKDIYKKIIALNEV